MAAVVATTLQGNWRNRNHGFHGFLLVGCAFVKAAKPSERIYGATDHDGLPLFI